MSSDARIAANRANSLLSTGPRTSKGKANSRTNAFKHGANADKCWPGQDSSAFKELVRDNLDRYKPMGAHERFHVRSIAKHLWLLSALDSALDSLIGDLIYKHAEREHALANGGPPGPDTDVEVFPEDVDDGLLEYVLDSKRELFERAQDRLLRVLRLHTDELHLLQERRRKRKEKLAT